MHEPLAVRSPIRGAFEAPTDTPMTISWRRFQRDRPCAVWMPIRSFETQYLRPFHGGQTFAFEYDQESARALWKRGLTFRVLDVRLRSIIAQCMAERGEHAIRSGEALPKSVALVRVASHICGRFGHTGQLLHALAR